MKLKLNDNSIVNVNVVSESTRFMPGEEVGKSLNISVKDDMTYDELVAKFTSENIANMELTYSIDATPITYQASGSIRVSVTVSDRGIDKDISISME